MTSSRKSSVKQHDMDDIADNPMTNPESIYTDFALIAEGESGPMFVAKHVATDRTVNINMSIYVYPLLTQVVV
ncbi:hypothetical protein G6F68_018282 [Rhizopus microsporus]|nr:hypothetical protein G6F68_018282 [Rhizopus microsporus]